MPVRHAQGWGLAVSGTLAEKTNHQGCPSCRAHDCSQSLQTRPRPPHFHDALGLPVTEAPLPVVLGPACWWEVHWEGEAIGEDETVDQRPPVLASDDWAETDEKCNSSSGPHEEVLS